MLLAKTLLTVAAFVGVAAVGHTQGTEDKTVSNKQLVAKYDNLVAKGERLDYRTRQTCYHGRKAVPFYRSKTWEYQSRRGNDLADKTPVVRGKSCSWVGYAVTEWRARAVVSKRKLDKWVAEHTLPDTNNWVTAVNIVQRFFPGTSWWLFSCSDSEGYNRGDPTRWVIYGGGLYFTGAENTYNGSLPQVGGPLQFMFGTFKGMYRRGLEYIQSQGYRVPARLRDPGTTDAWRSMLAQAIAGGWARYTGNDGHHWSGSGC